MALWLTESEATAYFTTRHGVGTLWTDLDTAGETALLTTAQAAIENNADYTFPDTVTQAMKDAVCEQAFALLLDPDFQLRAIVQAQGVTEAGLVKEIYRRAAGVKVIIVPLAKQLIASLKNDDTHEIKLVR